MERKPYSNPARPRGSGSSARRSISARPFEGDRNARAYDRGAYRSVASTDYRRSEYAGGAYRREEPHRRDAYAGSSHRRPPEPPRPRRAQPRRPKKRRNPLPMLLIGAFALAILIYLGSAWITVARNENTFCDNITINGVNLSGYTRSGGIQAVQDQITARLDTP